jgi:hypothetical protein
LPSGKLRKSDRANRVVAAGKKAVKPQVQDAGEAASKIFQNEVRETGS